MDIKDTKDGPENNEGNIIDLEKSMSDNRLLQFRNRKNKIEAVNVHNEAQKNQKDFLALLVGLSKRLFDLEKEVRDGYDALYGRSRRAYWGFLTVEKLLTKMGISQDDFNKTYKQVTIEEFEKEDAIENAKTGAINITDRACRDEDMVVINMKLFKDGKEIEDEEVTRMKFRVGNPGMAFPEVQDAVRGMNINEQKRIKFSLLGQTDEALITLIYIREDKPEPKGEGLNEEAKVPEGPKAG